MKFNQYCYTGIMYIACLSLIVGCGGGSGSSSNSDPSNSDPSNSDPSNSDPSPSLDISPDPFSLNSVSYASLSKVFSSETVTISGIDADTSISIIDGEYSINGSDLTESDGVISSGDTLYIAVSSSEKILTESIATVTIGSGEFEFSVTTGIYGAWLQECPEGTSGTDENACESDPWTLILGEAVLEGPGTMVSEGATCGGGDTWGTFSFADDQLELFNCNSDYQNSGTPGETATGQVFTASFEPTTEVLTLDNGTESYQLKSLTLESNALVAQRLISTDDIDCDGSGIDYHEISSAETTQWNSTLSYQDGKLFMDEFFYNEVSTGGSGWSFYEADDRGAQSAEYPAEAGVSLFDFRVVHAPDLTPISAVGHEVHCDGTIGDSNYKGWEIDFARDITYQRYWNNSSVDVTGEAFSSIDISDQAGVVSEVLVTANVTSTDTSMLKLVLTSPDGTSVILADGQNGDGSISNYYYTSFVDYGVADVTNTELTTFENLLTPEEPLSVLVGENLNGQWKLTVFDVGSGATISYFGLSVR